MALATGSQFGFEAILIWGALWFFVLMRFGFLASVVVEFGTALVIYFPFTFEGAAWYSGYGYLALAIFAALVLSAFRISLGGRPLLASSRFDD